MTKEDRELLLKDLCARVPYRVKCHFNYGSVEGDVTLSCIDDNVARFEYGWYGRLHVSIDANYIKPYLRPMSSMTKGETKELFKEIGFEFTCNTCGIPAHYNYEFAEQIKGIPTITNVEFIKVIDWLNRNHFDYRGLIPKGLAIPVTKENNPYK